MQKPTHFINLLILLAFTTMQSHAQQITNICVSQQSNKLRISYNLIAPAGQNFDINVKASTDGGRTFTITPKTLNGALKNVSPDNNQQIIWDVLNDMDVFAGDNMVFELEAVKLESWLRDTQTKIVDVYNPATGLTWMDRNLGASRASTSSTDEQSYGDLYQWGRAADGHEKRNSPITHTLSTTDTPGHGNFITASNSPLDWHSTQNDNLWQGVNGANNPCSSGYRLPTSAEWEAERASWSSNNAEGSFAASLRLSMAGRRENISGSLGYVGLLGIYWSSTIDGALSRGLIINCDDAYARYGYRVRAYSVRCIKD